MTEDIAQREAPVSTPAAVLRHAKREETELVRLR
jgi:hypothetical protein